MIKRKRSASGYFLVRGARGLARARAGVEDGTMAIEEQLDEALKRAMRTRDQPTMDIVRMLKARVAERRTAKGFAGQIDDALLLEVIVAYRKQMQKGLEEYARLGDKAKAQVEKLRFEIHFCSRFLPATLDEAHLEQLL